MELMIKMAEDTYDDSENETPDEMLEDDEISPEEEAFMKGYEDDANEGFESEDDIDKEFE